MLKVDLHMHTNEDPQDKFITHSSKELIDRAVELEFSAIAITLHSGYCYTEELGNYAKDRGLLLIPATELKVQGGDVLIYNISQEEFDILYSCKDDFEEFSNMVKELKKINSDIFLIAAHPYFTFPGSVGNNLIKYKEIFDAVEYSKFHTKLLNQNKKAVKVAKELNLPLFATSDMHLLENFGRNYTLVDAKDNTVKSIFGSIKKNKVKLVSNPIPFFEFVHLLLKLLFPGIFLKYKK